MSEQNATTTETKTDTTEEAFDLSKLARRYFGPGPESFAAAGELLEKVREAGLSENDIHFNFDLENGEVPDNYGIYVTPYRTRGKKDGEKPKVQAITFYAGPDFETVLADPAGRTYVADLLARDFASQHGASLRPGSDGIAPPAPWTLTDYIERRQRPDSLKSYNEIKNTLVASLKKAGLHNVNAANLKKSFSNAAIAVSLFPGVAQTAWEIIIDRAMALAASKDLDTTIFKSWKATRDQGVLEEDKFDASAFEAVLGVPGNADAQAEEEDDSAE